MEPRTLDILVVGLVGSGKTTLVDNLLDQQTVSELSGVVTYGRFVSGSIGENRVRIYDSPGLGDVSVYSDESYFAEIGEWIPKVDAVICCIKMNETTINESMIQMFSRLSKKGIRWEKVLIALTFADAISPSSKIRKAPGFDLAMYFNERQQEWKQELSNYVMKNKLYTLNADQLCFCPTTDDPETMLPDGKSWLNPCARKVRELSFREASDIPPEAGDDLKERRSSRDCPNFCALQ